MAVPKCIKCDNTTFSGKVRSVDATGRDMVFICCNKCGGVVGVAEQPGIVKLLADIANKLGVK